jgi:hypothetical protein
MVCQSCGSNVENEIHFCPRCGAPVAAAQPNVPVGPPQPPAYGGYPYPPQMVIPRVQRHLHTLGILWCVYGAFRLLSGLLGLFFVRAFAGHRLGWGGGNFPFNHWGGMQGPPWMALVPVIITVAVVMTSLSLIAGYGLLMRRSWARIFTIVLAVFALFKIPVGTALGIYTLWVLAPATSAMEYDSIADHS